MVLPHFSPKRLLCEARGRIVGKEPAANDLIEWTMELEGKAPPLVAHASCRLTRIVGLPGATFGPLQRWTPPLQIRSRPPIGSGGKREDRQHVAELRSRVGIGIGTVWK